MSTPGEGNDTYSVRFGPTSTEPDDSFRQLVDDLQVGVLIQGPGSEVLYGNRAAHDLLGLAADQLLGKTSFDAGPFAFHQDASPFPGADHPGPRAIATRKPVRDVVMGFRRPATQQIVWLLVNAEPQLAHDGSVARVITTFTDISDRRRAEQRLEESESRYRLLVENAQDVLYRTDVNGFFTYVNPVATRLVGYDVDEIVGRHFLEFIREDHRSRVEERLVRQFMERTATTYDEFVALTKDGREIWMGQNVHLLTEGEKVLGFQAVARDITERRRVDEALDRERRQLLEIVSHAPVAMAILDREGRYVACSEKWLKHWGLEAESVLERCDEARFRRQSRRYAEALRRALEGEIASDPEDAFEQDDGSSVYVRWYAHPWRGAGGTVGGVVTVVQNIDVLVRTRQAALEAARVRTEFLESLGDQIGRPLQQMQDTARQLLATPLDDGQRERAESMETAARAVLAVVDRVLDASRVESRRLEGRGHPERARATNSAPATRRVLVVEDNTVNQKVTVAMLRNLGYEADAVGDGLAAVEACERTRYEVVLMDCGLPGMDGFKATAWIRQREAAGRRTPIIAITASVMPGDRESCLAAGMDDYLSKPIRLEALGALLRKWGTRPAPADAPRRPESAGLPEDHPLRTLEAQGMASVVVEIIDVFLETTPLRLRELREACRTGDADALRELAHSLKGAAVQIGATAMGELCAQLLAAARSGSLGTASDLVNTLDAAFQAVGLVLQAERRRLG